MRKRNILILLVLLTSACTEGGSPIAENPEGSSEVSGSVSSINERLALDAGEERIVYHVGPIDLPANTPGETMFDTPLTQRFHVVACVGLGKGFPITFENVLVVVRNQYADAVVVLMLRVHVLASQCRR